MALFDAEELVMCLVGFHADILAGLQSHEDELQVMARVKNVPEGCVLFRQRFDVSRVAVHVASFRDVATHKDGRVARHLARVLRVAH
jgi:hypothetical protein